MYSIYLYLFLILINGFIPLGKFNAIFLIITWTIISFIIVLQNKNTKKNLLKNKINIVIICGIIGFIIYIFPYLNLYNPEQIKDHLLSFLNVFLYMIAGYEFINLFNAKFKNLYVNYISNCIDSQEKLLNLQKVNTFFCGFILLFLPYITKKVLFSNQFITMFLPGNDLNGYIYENIDFTSVSYLSLSIKTASRNSALLIPFVFIFIAYQILRKGIEYNEFFKLDKNTKKINLLIDDNKLYYSITCWISIIYLLCSGSRIGIILGYFLTITFLAKCKYFFRKDYKFQIMNVPKFKKGNKIWDVRLIAIYSFFLFIICVLPYNLFFPLNCREEFAYNTIFTNSTIPITYELRKVISFPIDTNVEQSIKKCNEYHYNNFISFSEFKSSSYASRFNLYTKNILGHESLIKDILFIIKSSILIIPIILLFCIVFLVIFLGSILQYVFNRRMFKNYRTFNYFDNNFITIIGSIYFLFNSVVSPDSAIAFGVLYLLPSIKLLRKIFILIF